MEEGLKYLSKYCYRYEHIDIARKVGIGPWFAGTRIYANTFVISKMCELYKVKHNIHPMDTLSKHGIQRDFRNSMRSGVIIISSPELFPTRKEAEDFPHRSIAKELTKLWRDFYDKHIHTKGENDG